jgi:hypothetical protein
MRENISELTLHAIALYGVVTISRPSVPISLFIILTHKTNYTTHTAEKLDFRLPVPEASVDRIFLASVFTHLFEEEVLHYMKESARVLKLGGLIYATFFLHTAEALAAAETKGTTPWKARFDWMLGDGVFSNDRTYPRGAVAFTDDAMRRLIAASGLRLARPYLKGAWSGFHAEPDDGQDVAILTRTDSPVQ